MILHYVKMLIHFEKVEIVHCKTQLLDRASID